VQVARLRIGQHDGANYIVGCGVFAQGSKRRDDVMYLSRGRVAKMNFTGQGAKWNCYMSCIPGFLFRNPHFFSFSRTFLLFPRCSVEFPRKSGVRKAV
jgi:hypothetical protein